jgi:MoxR-like ATPase
MSVAAREAGILDHLLQRRACDGDGLAWLPAEFLAEAKPWVVSTWSMSALPDLAYPQTRGERPADLAQWLGFVAALLRVAARDPAVHEAVVAVRYLAWPGSALGEPELVSKVMAEMRAGEPMAMAA